MPGGPFQIQVHKLCTLQISTSKNTFP